MKVIKEFQGVVDGEVYPRTFGPGDVCPPELQEAAVALGALEEEGTDAGAAADVIVADTTALAEELPAPSAPAEEPKAPAAREKKVKQ